MLKFKKVLNFGFTIYIKTTIIYWYVITHNSYKIFSEITSITEKSPADLSGLRPGDFLVKIQDDLVIFLSQQDISQKLKSFSDLELELEIERGAVEPMTFKDASNIDILPVKLEKESKNEEEEKKFTIILDKDRGIYHQ